MTEPILTGTVWGGEESFEVSKLPAHVEAGGISMEFSECGPTCEGIDESRSEYLGDGILTLGGTFHLHSRRVPESEEPR